MFVEKELQIVNGLENKVLTDGVLTAKIPETFRKKLEKGEIGMISEDYFLYWEELDWAIRARGLFTLGYAPSSIIYHKDSASTKESKGRKRSMVGEYYNLKNRIVLTKKYFPYALPTVYFGFLISG